MSTTELPYYYFVSVPSVVLYFSHVASMYLLNFPDTPMYDPLLALAFSVKFVTESTFRNVRQAMIGRKIEREPKQTPLGVTCLKCCSSACTYLILNGIHRMYIYRLSQTHGERRLGPLLACHSNSSCS